LKPRLHKQNLPTRVEDFNRLLITRRAIADFLRTEFNSEY